MTDTAPDSDRDQILAKLAAMYRASQGLSDDAPLTLIDKDHPAPGVPYIEGNTS